MTLLLLLACASDAPTWAVHHASVVPAETGLDGTQVWEFFDAAWAKKRDPKHYLCARAQSLVGEVTTPLEGCDGCVAAYAVATEELDSDCADDLATDAAYASAVVTFGIGDVPADLQDLDPWPGRSLGWFVSVDGRAMEAYGFAYDEALDWEGELGGPGWANGTTYTLWPAYAWDLRTAEK